MSNNNIFQEIDISSDFCDAAIVEKRIVKAMEKYGYDEEDVFALKLSLEEALANAILHGNQHNSEKKVHIRFLVNREKVDIYISDEGNGFNPLAVPDPTKEENLQRPNGRGIMLIRAYMNLLEYNPQGNVLHMVKLSDH